MMVDKMEEEYLMKVEGWKKYCWWCIWKWLELLEQQHETQTYGKWSQQTLQGMDLTEIDFKLEKIYLKVEVDDPVENWRDARDHARD